jgi:nitrate reductase (NAD(P)H)
MVFVVVAGTQPGGWMQRLKSGGLDPAKPVFSESPPKPLQPIKAALLEGSLTKPGINRKITAIELDAHRREGDPWFMVKGEVRLTWYSGDLINESGYSFRFTTAPAS